MTMYGYVSGYYGDKTIKDPNIERRVMVLLGSGIPRENCFADRFCHNNKERYELHKFFASIAKEGDILFVPELTDLYSNARELCCLMHTVERTGIVIKSSDMDLSDNSAASNWIIASQLARLDYTHYLHQKYISKAVKKAKYQGTLNVGGHNKRVITPKYKQAYKYLQTHTYTATQEKFHLSKSTLYRIKKQLENKRAANYFSSELKSQTR
ncbi:recombinase family protein [Limosilactobacillus reuteri]|uniref:recombinase family protein n=1 Tax=Limosilactobacillus reuteri TaxID=1598 RepID=UPI001E6352A7|nr:recombinase family protein [Limosilactobacillus reuteri]MCC4500163.1 recombinase family protein [Limosilactobacillus reuteri]MCC4506469.1 recombinase family protein [Limosilactobacillus reuteri]